VDIVLIMDIEHTFQHTFDDLAGFLLAEVFFLEEFGELAALDVLHFNHDELGSLEELLELDDVGVVQRVKDVALIP